jgi:site-specific recombinase XerD
VSEQPRRGRAPAVLPDHLQAVHDRYTAQLAEVSVFDPDTRRAYASRVRGYLAWLTGADVDGDPLTEPAARDGAVRDYKAHLQTVAKRQPSTINTGLAAINDFYVRLGLGAANAARLDLPPRAPKALDPRDHTRWLRAVERWPSPRDKVLALLPLDAGLRPGESVALDVDDVQLSARKGVIVVRAGKGGRFRKVPVHPRLRAALTTWIHDERPQLPGADGPALLLNHRGGRLSARGAHDVLRAIAEDAGVTADFTGGHILRHSFGTRLIREGHDLVLVAELMGHARLETTRGYTLPSDEDLDAAIASLPTDN